ncbi:PKD-like domain-containing protein [Echinicola rosea]|uniref:PKD domain-containing protein n=1 Tax=Echinicola rosea TaxID=1807691 RepID=A0ABQ1UZY3_9BACT|nr:PKD-like domain-containing protein [Echinicola rosea]GGF29113.1 hypothetical protein GCM10011339_16700 [Echinicola rosea]
MKKTILSFALLGLLASCMDDNEANGPKAPEFTIEEPENGFSYNKMSWARIQPDMDNEVDVTYEWILEGSLISQSKDLMYTFAEPGEYHLKFTATNTIGSISSDMVLTIKDTTYTNNLTRLYEFLPAPGQFVNKLPAWEEGISADSVLKKAEATLKNGSLISLGSFGGFATMGFDYTVINREGNDFIVLGNAFNNWSEPAIVMVAQDTNGNGLPDDEWFELYGSAHGHEGVIKDYEVTYSRPSSEPEDPNEQDYIAWEDNQGQTGFVPKNSFHRQSYFPGWTGDEITFRGTYIPSNIFDQSGNGSYWVNPAYEWGYVDNWPNNSEAGQMDISWARDQDGNAVELQGIDFVKVYNCNLAAGGWLGEVSTEIAGFTDLNLEGN